MHGNWGALPLGSGTGSTSLPPCGGINWGQAPLKDAGLAKGKSR